MLADDFRCAMLRAVEPHAGLPLLLSGGVDSGTVLAAQLALGASPVCYTFRFGGYPSEDNAVSRKMAAEFSLPYREIPVPRDTESILSDIREAIRLGGSSLKVHVQVCIPFLYLCRALVGDGHNAALFGMAADSLWGSGRHGTVAASKGTQAFYAHRAARIRDTRKAAFSVARLASQIGVALHDPWRDEAIISLLLAADYDALHEPRSKGLALKAFPEFWRRGAWYRPNKSLQVVSGIRTAHDTLLADPAVNVGGHRRVVGLYNEIARSL